MKHGAVRDFSDIFSAHNCMYVTSVEFIYIFLSSSAVCDFRKKFWNF